MDLDRLNKINTATFFKNKFTIKGQRTCEGCGQSVNILEVQKDGETVEVSECLNCENRKLEQEMTEFVKQRDESMNEIIYERYSIVPDDLKDASFDNYEPEHPSQAEALKKAVYYADKFGSLDFTSLLIKGPYGVGKSHLAKSISDRVKEQGKTVIYIDVPRLLRKIKNTFGTNESAEGIYKAIEKADLVIFDDLGAEYVKKDKNSSESWVGEQLFAIFTSRIGKAKIITTNCEPQELIEKYGDEKSRNGARIVSRMMQGAQVIKIDGRDNRLPEF